MKRNQNNMKTKISRSLCFAMSLILLSACVDTEVIPNDKTVGEDYWQTRDDVNSMIAWAYSGMMNSATQYFIAWGGMRSDELVPQETSNISGNYDDAYEIHVGSCQYDNVFCNWATLYAVINRCNIVLEKAPGVTQLDPTYTMATYYTDKSQMLALRSLCYFYLVRAFRDVPMTDGAYMTSSKEMEIPQLAPGVVLDSCIAALNEALADGTLSPQAYSDWRQHGLFNSDGIHALLADIYLFKASMTGDASDYQACVEQCDAVIQSKLSVNSQESQEMGGMMNSTSKLYNDLDYPLYSGANAYEEIFINGNSAESIFEIQATSNTSGSTNTNTGLVTMYWDYYNTSGSSYGGKGTLEASNIFVASSSATDATAFDQDDYRFYTAVFDCISDNSEVACVRKMLDQSTSVTNGTTSSTARPSAKASLGRDAFDQNWIVYRLTDVMLMKAEALVQLGVDGTTTSYEISESGDTTEVETADSNLREAFELVRQVNARSLVTITDSLTWGSGYTKSDLEELVLAERLRELCFEGKRWFDLLRYYYRHCEESGNGTPQPYKTMYELCEGTISAYPLTTTNNPMIDLLVRGYNTGGASIRAKLSKEPMLYYPVYKTEMNYNTKLNQNPAYDTTSSYARN